MYLTYLFIYQAFPNLSHGVNSCGCKYFTWAASKKKKKVKGGGGGGPKAFFCFFFAHPLFPFAPNLWEREQSSSVLGHMFASLAELSS